MEVSHSEEAGVSLHLDVSHGFLLGGDERMSLGVTVGESVAKYVCSDYSVNKFLWLLLRGASCKKKKKRTKQDLLARKKLKLWRVEIFLVVEFEH